ncbi:PH domain-containing protein [Lacticaseibacillus brantae]|uniref:YdbS-like PH domain-containing protein n=1 Tax=Lacticaseibacillus brantae DSM 23927 TaxID=1423727 RepID=A0A0R2AZS8_9LACO|nr:hypothetical protein FC34_GL000486 [Lacticaseibacillus brantae DSM 23927]
MGEALPKRIQWIWLISAVIWLLVLSGITGLIGFLVPRWHWWPWLTIVAIGLTIIISLGMLISIPYRYRFTRYQLSTLALEIQSGFFTRKFEAVPISRIQNVTLTAGPLLQWQHLQAVTIETASTSHTIDGIEPTVADQLRDQLLKLAQEARDE